MIDITPYQQKLTWLQEWISDRIDGRISPPMWVSLGEIASFEHSIEDILQIYEQCGFLFYTAKDVIENPIIPISFESYCEYRQQQEANIKYVTQ